MLFLTNNIGTTFGKLLYNRVLVILSYNAERSLFYIVFLRPNMATVIHLSERELLSEGISFVGACTKGSVLMMMMRLQPIRTFFSSHCHRFRRSFSVLAIICPNIVVVVDHSGAVVRVADANLVRDRHTSR